MDPNAAGGVQSPKGKATGSDVVSNGSRTSCTQPPASVDKSIHQKQGVQVKSGTPGNSESTDKRQDVRKPALYDAHASSSNSNPEDLDTEQLATSRMVTGDGSLLVFWDNMDTPGRVNPAMVNMSIASSSAGLVLVHKWQGAVMDLESWCMR